MDRIRLLKKDDASERAQELLEQVQQTFGKIPNIFKVMANSPAVLQSYLNFSGALSTGVLDVKIAERIALFISQQNDCEYCLSAHSMLAKNAGLSQEEILQARRGLSANQRAQSALFFAGSVYQNKGQVSVSDLASIREEGFSDEEVLEIIGHVNLTNLTNFINNVAQTTVDFPRAEPLETVPC